MGGPVGDEQLSSLPTTSPCTADTARQGMAQHATAQLGTAQHSRTGGAAPPYLAVLIRVKDSHAVLQPGVCLPVHFRVGKEAVAGVCMGAEWEEQGVNVQKKQSKRCVDRRAPLPKVLSAERQLPAGCTMQCGTRALPSGMPTTCTHPGQCRRFQLPGQPQ